jgi:hypothetical protein
MERQSPPQQFEPGSTSITRRSTAWVQGDGVQLEVSVNLSLKQMNNLPVITSILYSSLWRVFSIRLRNFLKGSLKQLEMRQVDLYLIQESPFLIKTWMNGPGDARFTRFFRATDYRPTQYTRTLSSTSITFHSNLTKPDTVFSAALPGEQYNARMPDQVNKR